MTCAANENELQKNLRIRQDKVKKRKMKTNVSKTKVILIGKERRNINIEVSNQRIEQVTIFKLN